MVQTVFSVPEVHCDNCVNSIEGAVKSLEGVQDVKVDLDRKDVKVSFDDTRLEEADIATVIEAIGYEVGDA